MSNSTGQVQVGPFLRRDLPTYQAAMQHVQSQWQHFLSRNQLNFLQCVLDRTTRFGKRYSFIAVKWFAEGNNPREHTGYAGCTPMVPVSEKTFYAIRQELVRLGILRLRRGVYAIDYSVNAIALSQDEAVQKRVINENRRGGALSTIDGILEWAVRMVERAIPTPIEAVDHINKDLPYTFHSKNDSNSSDKSEDNTNQNLRDRIMAKAEDVLAAVTSAVTAKQDKLKTKRKARRNLSDGCNLFEMAWASGQRETTPNMPINKLMDRDRALLKSRVIKPFETTDVVAEDFALWVATHWQAIGAQHFAKSKGYPQAPAFRWLVACLDTYVTAYSQKDFLNEDGTMDVTGNARIAKRTTEIVEQTEKVTASMKATQDDLRAQLAESRKEAEELKQRMGLDVEDDPVYAKVIKQARKTITIGNYDDEDATPHRPKPKPRKRR